MSSVVRIHHIMLVWLALLPILFTTINIGIHRAALFTLWRWSGSEGGHLQHVSGWPSSCLRQPGGLRPWHAHAHQGCQPQETRGALHRTLLVPWVSECASFCVCQKILYRWFFSVNSDCLTGSFVSKKYFSTTCTCMYNYRQIVRNSLDVYKSLYVHCTHW